MIHCNVVIYDLLSTYSDKKLLISIKIILFLWSIGNIWKTICHQWILMKLDRLVTWICCTKSLGACNIVGILMIKIEKSKRYVGCDFLINILAESGNRCEWTPLNRTQISYYWTYNKRNQTENMAQKPRK